MKHLALVTGLLTLALMGCTPGKTRIESPSGNISVEIHDKDSLVYSVSMEGRLVVDHSTLGLQFDPESAYDERKEIYRMSGKFVRSQNITQSARCNKYGRWTTCLACAVFVGHTPVDI